MNQLLKVQEIAEVLQMKVSTVYRLVEEGGLPAHKVGAALRFDVAKVLEHTEINGDTNDEN